MEIQELKDGLISQCDESYDGEDGTPAREMIDELCNLLAERFTVVPIFTEDEQNAYALIDAGDIVEPKADKVLLDERLADLVTHFNLFEN